MPAKKDSTTQVLSQVPTSNIAWFIVVVHRLQFLETFSREYKLVLLLNLNNSGQMVSIVVVHGHFFKKSTEHIKLSNGSLLAFSINSFRLFYWYFEDKKLSV